MLRIIIAGTIGSGKTMVAAAIAEALDDECVEIEWKDGSPADDLGMDGSIERKRRLLDGVTLGDAVDKVSVETVQLNKDGEWERYASDGSTRVVRGFLP